MKRREFISLLGGSVAAWPLAARAQAPAMPVIGFLNGASPETYARPLSAFREGLGEAGYVEGRNVAIEYRWAEGHNDRLPALADELVRRRVNVIAATSTPANLTAKKATTTIPIVFTTSSDPVQLGLVASLNRPGGNVTGVTTLNVEVGSKRLELLHELVPTATTAAVLVNPTNSIVAENQSRDLQAAARTLLLQPQVLQAATDRELETVFAALAQLRGVALVVGTDAFFFNQRDQLIALAARHAIPAIYDRRDFVTAGGLMSYGGSLAATYHLAGVYAGRLLKGEKPADLPVQQVTKLGLSLNLKTVGALGLTVPPALVGRTDEVIE
jgi:putative ABC transport system substrate-binding protein